jgi:hypothetical protein
VVAPTAVSLRIFMMASATVRDLLSELRFKWRFACQSSEQAKPSPSNPYQHRCTCDTRS